MFILNRTNSIKCIKNTLDGGNIQFFIIKCDFLSFYARPLIWMCCMEKFGRLFCCMEVGSCFRLFYWLVFYLVVHIHSFNSTTISLGTHGTIFIGSTKSQPSDFCSHCTTFKLNILDVYAHGYKKLWGLYRINLDNDWYLIAVISIIFGCSVTHFWTKFGTN